MRRRATISGRAVALALILMLGSGPWSTAQALSQADLERLNGFALLLGRGLSCNLDISRARRVIEDWLDQSLPRGSAERARYLPLFIERLRYHARAQHLGQSPDSCADVARAFEDLYW